MSQLTKRQHNVPVFYLGLWSSINSGKVVCHDLKDETSFEVSPEKILVRRYFYEEDADTPDNRIENILAYMEGQCSPHFSALSQLDIKSVRRSKEKECLRLVQDKLTSEACDAIKTFAAYQYLRVPGAIEQKRCELTTTDLTQMHQDYLLNAGRFVESGFSYVKKRFQSLKLMVLMSAGQDFITSDRPCFDLKDSDSSPLLGEEIGVRSEVIAYLPLTPRLGVVLYPPHHAPQSGSHLTPEAHVIVCVDSSVRNQNTLIIQQSDRFVVANTKKSFIFKVAKKRKKNKNA